MNNIDVVYNVICFFLFGGLFYGLYFTIYAPTFHQNFTPADNCKVIDIQEFVVMGDRKNENYKYLTIKIEHENEVFYGCGCHSDKKKSRFLDGTPYPFFYYKRGDIVRDGQTNIPQIKYNQSEVKMPSWFCIDKLESVYSSKCMFNRYGDSD